MNRTKALHQYAVGIGCTLLGKCSCCHSYILTLYAGWCHYRLLYSTSWGLHWLLDFSLMCGPLWLYRTLFGYSNWFCSLCTWGIQFRIVRFSCYWSFTHFTLRALTFSCTLLLLCYCTDFVWVFGEDATVRIAILLLNDEVVWFNRWRGLVMVCMCAKRSPGYFFLGWSTNRSPWSSLLCIHLDS